MVMADVEPVESRDHASYQLSFGQTGEAPIAAMSTSARVLFDVGSRGRSVSTSVDEGQCAIDSPGSHAMANVDCSFWRAHLEQTFAA
jgi:hypothetical protein